MRSAGVRAMILLGWLVLAAPAGAQPAELGQAVSQIGARLNYATSQLNAICLPPLIRGDALDRCQVIISLIGDSSTEALALATLLDIREVVQPARLGEYRDRWILPAAQDALNIHVSRVESLNRMLAGIQNARVQVLGAEALALLRDYRGLLARIVSTR